MTESKPYAAGGEEQAYPRKPMVQAVIFLGGSSLSMMLAEVGESGMKILDVMSFPLKLALDVFRTGSISRETIDLCVQVTQGYTRLLDEYRRGADVRVRLLATNVLLDMRNMDSVINRLQTACGLRLEVMDDGEMTRLLYLNMKSMLDRHPELNRKRVLVLHVGPGNTRVLLFDKGRITYYAGYRLGAHRTSAAIDRGDLGDASHECSLIREHIRGVVEQLRHDSEDIVPAEPDAMVIFGPDFHRIDSPLLEGDEVTLDKLGQLVDEMARTPFAQRMARYHEDEAGANALLPACVIYLAVAREFSPRSILVPREESAYAFLRNLMPAHKDDQALEQEVLHFSRLLAKRYKVDQGHSQQVLKLCKELFKQLQSLHGLSGHDLLLLKVAAILHEVGAFISPKNHHLHGQYIILNSEIFGLSRKDVELIGLLARYHRHGMPSADDRSYAELELPDRLRLQKMAALLRVADAMERSHSHRISEFRVRMTSRMLELLAPGVHDLTIENMALKSKGNLFTEVFGYDVRLMPAVQDNAVS